MVVCPYPLPFWRLGGPLQAGDLCFVCRSVYQTDWAFVLNNNEFWCIITDTILMHDTIFHPRSLATYFIGTSSHMGTLVGCRRALTTSSSFVTTGSRSHLPPQNFGLFGATLWNNGHGTINIPEPAPLTLFWMRLLVPPTRTASILTDHYEMRSEITPLPIPYNLFTSEAGTSLSYIPSFPH